jgi:glutaredoxin 3
MSNKITVWGQPNCKYCESTKQLLKAKGIDFVYRSIDTMDDKAEFFEVTNGARSVPQIFVGEKHIGGIDKLREYLHDHT